MAGGIAWLSLLVAAAWVAMVSAPGGPDSTARYVVVGVAAAIAVVVAVIWLSRPEPGPRIRTAFIAGSNVACLAAGVAAVDGRVGLVATVPLAFVGMYAATFSTRPAFGGQMIAATVVVFLVTVIGVADGGEDIAELSPFVVQAAFAALAVPVILHHGLTIAGRDRTATQTGEPMQDTLTEVLTRHGLYSAAQTSLSALNRKSRLVVVRVHLDQFQDITVGDGRERGEQVLKRVAHRLAQGVRGGDFVARTGDAEFSALAGVTDEGVEIFANRFRELVFDVEDPVPVSASVGVAFAVTPIASTDVQTTIDDLLHRAEVAMQAAHDAGGDRVEIDWSADPTAAEGPGTV
ncbi:GGDEF domain-containing protein [Williamsia serinedens]|uniref:Diguanylate cyclase (GGDEF) domain-containing protein n=1 Tax=Williamsia serinedens TaxID=391736 RepID=A0ABT1GZM2_9NOCA|nr:GGDEF domain-containing protein [Williamsia serinedens]MCP2159972.1 diguanylate cyclase (GGDEF) domain-containing protein [Williamsia serinedens]